MKPCTIRDVALRAGVSISTVSRYLKDPKSINAASSAAVGQAIRDLNYVPNPFAQGLKREDSKMIGVVLPDLGQGFFGILCKALETVFLQNGYMMMLCCSAEDSQREQFYVESMLKYRAAGILVAPICTDSAFLHSTVEENSNILLFDREVPDLNVGSVTENNEQAGYDLAAAMLRKGHRKLALIPGNRQSINTGLRLRGIRRACRDAGVELDERYVQAENAEIAPATMVEGFLSQILADPEGPRCVIACNPLLTDNLVTAAYRHHVQVPRELELAGFSTDAPGNLYTLPVTVMSQDPERVGREAALMMLRQIRGKAGQPKKTVLPMKLYESE